MLQVGFRSLLPFITIPIFTRILTPKDYGVLALAMIYAIIMNGIVNFGLLTVFERNYFQYRGNPRKLAQLFYSTITFIIINFVFLYCLTYLFKKNISTFLTGSNQYDILILTAFAAQFFSGTILNFFLAYFKNAEKAKTHTKYQIANSLLNMIISIILVAYVRVGIIGIIISQLITGLLLFLILLYSFVKELHFSLNKKILFESLKISYPLVPGAFVKVISMQFDKYMIGLLATIGGVGVYHIGKTISDPIFTFMTAIENVFNPQVYQRMFGHSKQRSESIGKYLTPFLYFSIFVALSIALFSEELLTILTPTSYHGAIPIVGILSMYIGFLFFGKTSSLQLLYVKKTNITLVLTFLTLGLNIGLNIPFIMMFGVIGAAWATMLAGLISGTIRLLIAQHYYKIGYEWTKIISIMGTFFIGSIIIVSMNLLDIQYLWSILVKIASMIIYINLGIRYGIISKENIANVRSIIRLRKIKIV
jgi:O-antigen/teichoic acid export membrane protein